MPPGKGCRQRFACHHSCLFFPVIFSSLLLLPLLLVWPVNGQWSHHPQALSSQQQNIGGDQLPLHPPIRPSLFEPMLKTKSQRGYLSASAGPGTFVRIAPSVNASPLQILVEDKDLQPGMSSAVYQYVLSGIGAQHFAVDQHGNLYLADVLDAEGSGSSATNFVLSVMAREVDTQPTRSSEPLGILVQVLEDDHLLSASSSQAPTLYIANVSATDLGERVIAQVKARDGDGAGPVEYRIVEVSDSAAGSFRYDEATNELRAVGPLHAGHRYKVVIEARDSQGLVGHAVVLVNALSLSPVPTSTLPHLRPASATALLPAEPNTRGQQQLALIPADVLDANAKSTMANGEQALTNGRTHPTEKSAFVELSELAPIASVVVSSLGDGRSHGKVHFVLAAGNEEGKFVVEPGTGRVLTAAELDREQTGEYQLRIEARSSAPFDQLLYVTNLHVRVLDANDNAPQFTGPVPLVLRTRLNELSPDGVHFGKPNLLIGRVHVRDVDAGENGRVSLRVMPPLDRLFSINDAGEVRTNGLLSAAHLGEHHLTIEALDHGLPPQESRAVLGVRIDGQFASNIRETLLGPVPPTLGIPPTYSAFGLALAGHPEPASSPAVRNTSNSAPPSPSSLSSADYESAADTSGGGSDSRQSGLEVDNHNQQHNGHVQPLFPAERSFPPPSPRPPPPFTRLEAQNVGLLSSSVSGSASTPPASVASSTATADLPRGPPSVPSQSSSSVEELVSSTRLAPIFDSAELKVYVEENEEQMELTRLRARYPDDGPGPVHFVLLAGDQSLFGVNSTSGQVTLLKALDAESEQQPPIYRLKVGTVEAGRAEQFLLDPGLAHSCELTIHVVDINDWIPNFEQEHYEFVMAATANAGTMLGQVTAMDHDLTAPNNKIEYRLLPADDDSSRISDASSLFQIDPDSGQIILVATNSLANLAGQQLAFKVQAVDGGIDGTELNSTAKVTVHVEGSQKVEEEEEEELEGDARTKGENAGEAEMPSSSTASSAQSTTVTGGPTLPSSSQQPLPLPAPSSSSSAAGNGIQFASRQFNASVPEGARPPVLVQMLEVRNKPRDTRFTICAIRAGNFRGAFSVATNSDGNCELRTQVQLDREAVEHYQLNTSVESGGQTDWAVVNVSVLDTNDNKPRFVFPPRENGTAPDSASFFVVCPVETQADARFFKLMAEDGDAPGSGNSLVSFELEGQSSPSGDAQYFGIEPKTGQLYARKKVRELAQLLRRNYFRLTAKACDNPADLKRRLCSKAPVAISLLDDQHRFLLSFVGTSPEHIKRHEKELLRSLSPFTAPCPHPAIERVVEEESPAEGNGQSVVNVLMHAVNLKDQKLCLKQEFPKMFTADAKEKLAASMRQWDAVLLDVLGATDDNGRVSREKGPDTAGEGGMAALLFPIDWGNASTVLVLAAAAAGLVALVGLCALFLFRARHKQMRRRAEQMRRRNHQHRGFNAAAGLLAVNGAKGPQAIQSMNGLFASSYAASSNVSNNLYLPAATPLGSSGFERRYESQMMELPIGDGNEFGDAVCNGHGKCANAQLRRQNEDLHGQLIGETHSSKSSPNRRLHSSGLLPPPPPPSQFHQQTRNVQIGRLTNSDNVAFPGPSTSSAMVFRRHHSPPAGVNQEGDFSIEENFYSANGQQARYVY